MEPGQDNTVAIVAIAVSGGVSFLVAVLAAIAAHKRQEKALEAERRRLLDQLAHDRELNDLDGVRQLLDDCLIWILAMSSTLVEADAVLRDKTGPLNEGDLAAVNQIVANAKPSYSEVPHLITRLVVRFDDDDHLCTGFMEFWNAAKDSLLAVGETGLTDPEAAMARRAELRPAGSKASVKFRTAARAVGRPRLADAPH